MGTEACTSGRVSGKTARTSTSIAAIAAAYGFSNSFDSNFTSCGFCGGSGDRYRKTYVKACRVLNLHIDKEPVYFRSKRLTHLGANYADYDEGGSCGGDTRWSLQHVPPLWWLRTPFPEGTGQFQRIQHAQRQVPQLPRNWALAPRRLSDGMLNSWLGCIEFTEYVFSDYSRQAIPDNP